MRTWSGIFVLQHKGCLHNVPVYRLVLTARRIMARRTSFSRVEWRNEALVLNMWRPQFHLNPQESANIPKHVSPDGTLAHSLELSKLFCTLFCLWDANVLLFVVVKVARIPWSSALWQEGGFNLKIQSAIFICSCQTRAVVHGAQQQNQDIPFSHRQQSSLLWRTTCDSWCHSHRSSGCQISLSGLPGAGFSASPSGRSWSERGIVPTRLKKERNWIMKNKRERTPLERQCWAVLWPWLTQHTLPDTIFS